METESFYWIDRAIDGDRQALEELLLSVQDMLFNLSLRMLGNLHDAEDASQEICVRIITGLSGFKKESAFSTWVYRIASNHLLNYKKSMFMRKPLSFDSYGMDIQAGFTQTSPNMAGGVEEDLLASELKMSCTNVMLQCLDAQSRLIYVLGVMLRVDSTICGEILGMTPQAYRQRLSRIRQKMSGFLKEYCGLGLSERCDCRKRIGYAIQNKRLNPANLEYSSLAAVDPSLMAKYTQAMEELDEQSLVFAELPKYKSPQAVKDFLKDLLSTENMAIIRHTN